MHAGELSFDAAPLLGGAALVLSFVLLHQRRVRACIAACALQGWVVGLAAASQGWMQGEPQLTGAALLTLAANGVVLPLALARVAERLKLPGAVEPALGAFAAMLLGFLLAALALLAVRPAALGAATPTREELALALSVVLLSLAGMIIWRNALMQVVEGLALGNGLILAVAAVPGMPMVVELAVAVLAMEAFAVLGMSFRLRGRYG